MLIPLIIFSAALFIDGATDCANCVTGAHSSNAMSLRAAVITNAALSFLGCVLFSLFFPSVAKASSSAVTIPSEYTAEAVVASLLSVALWSGFAWLLGLPTSEGHGLIAATAGAAFCLGGEIYAKQLAFIFLSVFPCAALAAVLSKIFCLFLKRMKDDSCRIPIILSAVASSFFHGAQDGQKFIALAMSASLINEKNRISLTLLFSFFMAVGAFFGKRIIRKMGEEMVQADKRSALGADLGSVSALSLLTLLGVPASTTHLKIVSLAFSSKIFKNPSQREIFILTAVAWLATFPICFFLGFFLSKLIFVIKL